MHFCKKGRVPVYENKHRPITDDERRMILKLIHFYDSFFVITYMSIFSWHKNSPYGSLLHSTIGGLFFLLSIFYGLVHYYFKPSLFFEMSLKFFAHFNSCCDFDLSNVSQKSQS